MTYTEVARYEARRRRAMRWMLLLVVAIGLFGAWAALAQPIVEGPQPVDLVPGEDLAILKLGVFGLIMLLVRGLRGLVPQMADGSMRARWLTATACAVFGVALGLLGAAPAMVATNPVAGQVLGGIGAGALAFLTAGLVGSSARGEAAATDGAPRP